MMNRKTKRIDVALQIGTESPSQHHLQEYLLVYFYLLRLQVVLETPKLFLFILERGFLCPPSSVFSPQGAQATASGQGEAPWLLMGSGINSNTPSVRDDGMVVSGGGGGIPFIVPVTGMYFVHSDHLGSVSFLTNGRGAIIAGGEFGGKSDIQYKPYGEIDRPHSSGPDISKYKYTGQEEDKESGLLYYKARYYDPGLGRFLQADEEVHPESIQGMNRCMYAEGNPVKFSDDSGYRLSTPLAWAWIEVLTMPEDSSHEERVMAFAKGYKKGNDIRKQEKKEERANKVAKPLRELGQFYMAAGTVWMVVGAAHANVIAMVIGGALFLFGAFLYCMADIVEARAFGLRKKIDFEISVETNTPPEFAEKGKPKCKAKRGN